MKYKQVFVENAVNCIDVVNPETGRSGCFNQTLAEIQERYPGAYIAEFEAWIEAKEKALCTEPEEITEERWYEMLEVLPPQRWHRQRGFECFELSEHLSGRVTSIFCRLGTKFFEFNGIAGQSPESHFVHCGGVATT